MRIRNPGAVGVLVLGALFWTITWGMVLVTPCAKGFGTATIEVRDALSGEPLWPKMEVILKAAYPRTDFVIDSRPLPSPLLVGIRNENLVVAGQGVFLTPTQMGIEFNPHIWDSWTLAHEYGHYYYGHHCVPALPFFFGVLQNAVYDIGMDTAVFVTCGVCRAGWVDDERAALHRLSGF